MIWADQDRRQVNRWYFAFIFIFKWSIGQWILLFVLGWWIYGWVIVILVNGWLFYYFFIVILSLFVHVLSGDLLIVVICLCFIGLVGRVGITWGWIMWFVGSRRWFHCFLRRVKRLVSVKGWWIFTIKLCFYQLGYCNFVVVLSVVSWLSRVFLVTSWFFHLFLWIRLGGRIVHVLLFRFITGWAVIKEESWPLWVVRRVRWVMTVFGIKIGWIVAVRSIRTIFPVLGIAVDLRYRVC